MKFCRHLPPLVIGNCRNLSPFAAVHLHLTFTCSLPSQYTDELSCALMTETAQRKHGGRAYHSVLEPHFDFIQQQRQRRKTWQEIANLLLSEKGIHVTFYAPYRFYRRRLKRAAKPNWESSAGEIQPTHPSAIPDRSPSRPAPLPVKPTFKRPALSTINPEEFT